MKIIEKGRRDSEEVYQGLCLGCDTKVEFRRKEAKIFADSRNDTYLTVECPVCAKIIYVTL